MPGCPPPRDRGQPSHVPTSIYSFGMADEKSGIENPKLAELHATISSAFAAALKESDYDREVGRQLDEMIHVWWGIESYCRKIVESAESIETPDGCYAVVPATYVERLSAIMSGGSE